MSAFKNTSKARRRTHKERHQPKARARLGLLEKHKDYVKRARDFQRKKKRLRAMRERASLRNPDEFYFGMEHSRVVNGRHVSTKSDDGLSHKEMSQIRHMDAAYATNQRQAERKKVERLSESLLPRGSISGKKKKKKRRKAGGPQHVVFVDTPEEAEQWDPVQHFDTVPELVHDAHNRARRDQLADPDFLQGATSAREVRAAAKAARRRYTELSQRMVRERKLTQQMREAQLQKDLLGKGARKKVKQRNGKTVYKWRRERKR